MEKKEYTQDEKDAYRKMRQEKFQQAYREARDEIIGDAEFRMEEAKSRNEEQAILYTFHFAKDASAKVDSNGTRLYLVMVFVCWIFLRRDANHF